VSNINTKFNGVGSSLIDVASGDLNVNSVGFDSGEINVVPGAHFYWEANARRTVQGALTLTGLGSVQMMAATLVVPVNSNLVNANTPFTLSGTLQGPGNVVMSAPLYWSDGAIEGFSNGLILGGVTTLGPALSKYITRGTILTLTNTTDWRGNNIYIDGDAAIENYGVFTIRADSDLVSLGAGASFNNRDGALGRGVVQKTSGAGVTRIEVAFVNEGDLFLNGRKITFQEGLSIPSGGLANLGGGVLGLDAGQSVVVSGGMLTGGGVVGGDLSVTQGWVIVTSGATLSVAGDYIQGAVAILQFQYQNAWGSLVVGGTASLAGMLDVVVAAGSPPNVWTDVLTATNSVQFTFSVTPARYNVQYSAIAVQIKKP
jgi:hypothetical protein